MLSRKVQESISANWSLRTDDDRLWYPGRMGNRKTLGVKEEASEVWHLDDRSL